MSADYDYEKLDDELVQKTLGAAPFVPVEGVINFRDFGALQTDDSNLFIKQKYLFRSGELTRLSENGKDALRKLGVKAVFDLRTKAEVERYKSTTPAIEGIQVVHAPVFEKDEIDHLGLAAFLQNFEANEQGAFASTYARTLESGGPAFETILKHLRDKPDEPCLVHCTAGKDRTGVLVALVLMLLGARDEDIIKDYALSTIGLQPAAALFIARWQQDPVFRDNWQGALNMGSAKAETMQATLKMIREKYGGAEAYFKRYTSLSDDDLVQIRKNLLVPYP